MEQLVPGKTKLLSEVVKVVEERLGDVVVDGVVSESQIAGQQSGLAELALDERVGVGGIGVQGLPLRSTARGLGKGEVVVEQREQELCWKKSVYVVFLLLQGAPTVSPLGGSTRPDNLKTTGVSVISVTSAKGVLPSKALLLERSGVGLGADIIARLGTVGLAKGVATSNQSNGFLIVHAHAAKGLADIQSRRLGVRGAVGSTGVNVDETHADGSKRALEPRRTCGEVRAAVVSDNVVAIGGEHVLLGTPVDALVGLVGVLTAEAKAVRGEAHVLHGSVAGEDEQIGPGESAAVLLLDGPCICGVSTEYDTL